MPTGASKLIPFPGRQGDSPQAPFYEAEKGPASNSLSHSDLLLQRPLQEARYPAPIQLPIAQLIDQARRLPTSDQQSLIIALVNSPGVPGGNSFETAKTRRVPERLEVRKAWEAALDNVFLEAAIDDWDGYGARRVERVVYHRAKRFLKALPTTEPGPEIAADPDGDITFEWHRSPQQVLTISIGKADQLSYAGLFGVNKVHGAEHFTDELPKAITDNLERLSSELR